MKLTIDQKTIGESGFNNYLSRTSYGQQELVTGGSQRYLKAQNITSGRVGSQGILTWGSEQLKTDANKIQHLVFDGTNARILIGKLS